MLSQNFKNDNYTMDGQIPIVVVSRFFLGIWEMLGGGSSTYCCATKLVFHNCTNEYGIS